MEKSQNSSEPETDNQVPGAVVQSILRSLAPDLHLITYRVKKGTAAGDNYMSIMFAIEISAQEKANSASEPQTLHVMLKTMPLTAIRRQIIFEMKAFEREAKMYDQVFPEMVRFQKDNGTWEGGEIYNQFPKCYTTFCDGKSDYIAMENLKQQGFKMANRQQGLDFAHSSLVVRHMARFHAISHSMFGGDYAAIRAAYPFLEERHVVPLDRMPTIMRIFCLESLTSESNLLRTNGYENEAQVIDVLKSEEYYQEQYRLVGAPVPNAVIGHGDCWINNLLFKYADDDTEEHKAPLELKFVDFQLSRASSRMIDFSYFLHTSPQMQIMNEQWEELLRIYYEEFTNFSLRLGHHDQALTYEKLLEEYHEFKLYGVVMGIIMCPAISAAKEEIPDMERLPDSNVKAYTSDRFEQVLGTVMKGETFLPKLLNLINNHAMKFPFVVQLLEAKYH